MLILILFLIVGSALVYLSQSNLNPVSVYFGQYVFPEVPLFYVITGAIGIGLVISYVIHVAYVLSVSITMRAKDKELKSNKEEVLELTKRVHQLELEIEKVKNASTKELEDPNAL